MTAFSQISIKEKQQEICNHINHLKLTAKDEKYGVASISNTLQNLKQVISHIIEITLYSKEKEA